MHNEIPELDRAGLRNFGLMFAAFFSGIFALLLPFIRGVDFPWWPLVVSALVAVFSLVFPDRLEKFYKLWMRFGMAIGAVVTRVILSIVFYVVIFPMGLVMRLAGKDPMNREIHNKGIKSYRVESKVPARNSMERPF